MPRARCDGWGLSRCAFVESENTPVVRRRALTTACLLQVEGTLAAWASSVAYGRERSWQGLHMEVFISSLAAGSRTPPPLFYHSPTFVLTAADRHHFLLPS